MNEKVGQEIRIPYRSWSYVDRSSWTSGPWDDETEDAIQFMHENYPCMIRRGERGHWCGFVALYQPHPMYGAPVAAPVHGGISLLGVAEWDQIEAGPCILDLEDELITTKTPYWVGFDCDHIGDLNPHEDVSLNPDCEYRSSRYAMRQTQLLAALMRGCEYLDLARQELYATGARFFNHGDERFLSAVDHGLQFAKVAHRNIQSNRVFVSRMVGEGGTEAGGA